MSIVAAEMRSFTLVSLTGHWLMLWYGFQLLSRKPRSLATKLASVAIIFAGLYMGSMVMEDAALTRDDAVFWSASLGMLPALAAALWFHVCVSLTDTTFRGRRPLLAAGYIAAVVVIVLGSTTSLFYDYHGTPMTAHDEPSAYAIGSLFPLFNASILVPVAGAVVVLIFALRRSSEPARGQLALLLAGTACLGLGAALIFANAYADLYVREAYLQPVLVVGGLVTAYPLARFRGLVEGQLLWNDLKASLVGALLVMTAFAALVTASGGSHFVLFSAGWIVLAAFVFHGQLRALADRPFFSTEARADRADLLAAARFAGGPSDLDLSALSGGQAQGLLDYASDVERAGLAWERLRFERDLWMEILGRDDFVAVRRALGVPLDWSSRQPFPLQEVRERVEAELSPRERLAVGLKYLGYSDREMAEFMGVKPNVPRSYLSSAKAKLDLPAGPALTLFAHFSGVVSTDALPRVRTSYDTRGGAGSVGEAPRDDDELESERTSL